MGREWNGSRRLLTGGTRAFTEVKLFGCRVNIPKCLEVTYDGKCDIDRLQTTVVVLLAIFSALAVIDKGVAAFRNIFLKDGDGMEKRIKTIEEKTSQGLPANE